MSLGPRGGVGESQGQQPGVRRAELSVQVGRTSEEAVDRGQSQNLQCEWGGGRMKSQGSQLTLTIREPFQGLIRAFRHQAGCPPLWAAHGGWVSHFCGHELPSLGPGTSVAQARRALSIRRLGLVLCGGPTVASSSPHFWQL